MNVKQFVAGGILRAWLSGILVLPVGFLCLIAGFQSVDFYHYHFFESGVLVFAYNLARIVFVFYLGWLIYFIGIATLNITPRATALRALPLSERMVLGFATGLGVWQIVLLLLGLLGLFYRPLMIGIAGAVLASSVPHFSTFAAELRESSRQTLNAWRGRDSVVFALSASLFIGALVLLLMTRGLYPGGGHDYYTHYFYYYHDVIANHGLAPNDVWYHYYYSKGAGLFFFGILLTDLQAPELVSFCCVTFASIALAVIVARVAPKSTWPLVTAALYLLFNIIALAGPHVGGGASGEFQKSHVLTSACIVLVVCVIGLCRRDFGNLWWPGLIATAAAVTAANILSIVAGVLLGVFFFVAMLAAKWRSKGPAPQFYGALWLTATVGVAAILLLNYLVTGLASDQMLNLMWRWANVERLHVWGVLPMVLATAWIRHNYSQAAVPLGMPTLGLIVNFLRWTALWPLATTGVAAAAVTRWRARNETAPPPLALSLFAISGCFLVTCSVIAVIVGRSQTYSFFRFSEFFFPLLLLVGVSGWAISIATFKDGRLKRMLAVYVPLLFLMGIPLYWQIPYKWLDTVAVVSANAGRFLVGSYSLAQAYTHQKGRQPGFVYGAIYPGALQAMRQVGQGTRIWSMHIHSYCLAPKCRIESVMSFKMSRHLNDILNGPPDQAQAILHREGLNYFLVSKDLVLFDMLPYSKLFDPDNIAQHLAIKWTNGSTYLLTWRGPDTKPITPEFLRFYRQKVQKERSAVFNFAKFVPELALAMKHFAAMPHPWKPIPFPWDKH